jgi:hypothetical protein
MANILLSLEHGIEVGASDILRFLTFGQATAAKLEPGVIAALGVVLGTIEKTMTEVHQPASSPLSVTLDAATVNDLRAIWPAVAAFAGSLGIKF